MRQYTISEAIEDMKDTIQVFREGYGTWKVKGYLGLRSTGECAEGYFTTHDEDWKTGAFDGETYNPQDFDSWYDEQEWLANGWDEEPSKDDSEVRAMFDDYCNAIWSDSTNNDNYSPASVRDEAAARQIIEAWVDGNAPRNVFVTADNSTIYVLDDSEREFAESETANLAMLVDGRGDAFINAFDSREEG
jgi:hypothetical protein